jgi:hypothetical protein
MARAVVVGNGMHLSPYPAFAAEQRFIGVRQRVDAPARRQARRWMGVLADNGSARRMRTLSGNQEGPRRSAYDNCEYAQYGRTGTPDHC